MNTQQNYTHIQVTAGIGVPVNPIPLFINSNACSNDKQKPDDDWSDWQAAHAGIQWHCLNPDGTAVADNTYQVGDFGEPFWKIRTNRDLVEAGIDKEIIWRDMSENSVKYMIKLPNTNPQFRLVRYLKQPAEVQATELEIPEPIGNFIISQKDITPFNAQDGAWYHYSDVCKLLNRLKSKIEDE